MSKHDLKIVAEKLRTAASVAVLTGAGISAESGLATFRDPDGLWQQFRPEELANVNAFLSNPSLVQLWYQSRRRASVEAEPNPGHLALVQLQQRWNSFTLITQNVDGLHKRAGSTNVIELHGNILRNYCIDCRREATLSLDASEISRCLVCGGLIRPDVVWFGEQLPPAAISRAYDAASSADAFLSIGTSAVVFPAADLPIAAKRNGSFVVEINTEETAISSMVDVSLRGQAGAVLPALLRTLDEVTV